MTPHKDVFRGEWLGVFLHLAFGFFGGCIITVALAVAIEEILGLSDAHLRGSGSIYDPIFWVPGLFVGGLVNRFARHRWAYLAPSVVAALIVLWVTSLEVSVLGRSPLFLELAGGHPWRYEFERLFSVVPLNSGDKGAEQLFITFPFLSNVAYSIGALIALGVAGRKGATATSSAP